MKIYTNSNIHRQNKVTACNFKGIDGPSKRDKECVKELFGENLDIFNDITDAKDIDVWVLYNQGNINAHILDKDTNKTLKDLSLNEGGGEKNIDTFRTRLKDCVLYANAQLNLRALKKISLKYRIEDVGMLRRLCAAGKNQLKTDRANGNTVAEEKHSKILAGLQKRLEVQETIAVYDSCGRTPAAINCWQSYLAIK